MSFDPDTYLQAKTTPFDPDAYLDKKTRGPGIGEAALRGAGQGATAGFGDEMAAAIGAAGQKILPESIGGIDYGKSLKQLYRENRDTFRRENDTAKEAHPVVFGAGQVGGSMPSALLAAGKAPSAARLLLSSIGLSGASGAGESTEESAGGVAADAGKSAAIGGALAGGALAAGKFGAPLLKQAMDKIAVKSGRRVLTNVTNSLSAKKPVSADAVLEALDSGAIKFGGTTEGASARLDALRQSVGDQKGKIVQALSAAGIEGPEVDALAQKYAAELAAARAGSMNPAVPRVFSSAVDQIKAKPNVNGRLSLQQAEDMKGSLQDMADAALRHLDPPELEQAKKAAASMMRQAVEDEITTQAPGAGPQAQAIAAQFKPVKQQAGRLIEASDAAREGAARSDRRSGVSLIDAMAAIQGAGAGYASHGAAGGIVGGPGGLLLSHLLRTRGPSTVARSAHAVSSGIDYLTQPALTPSQAKMQALIEALKRALPAASEEVASP